MGDVLTTRIRPKGLDGGGELSANYGDKVLIVRKQLAAVMHKVNPSEMCAIIHKQDIISISILRYKRGRTPYIRVNKIKRGRRLRQTRGIRELYLLSELTTTIDNIDPRRDSS